MSEHTDDQAVTLVIEHEDDECRFWISGERNAGGTVFIMLLYEEITREIIGAAMEVHTALGPGFLEAAYEKALAHELALRKLHFTRQVVIPVHYKKVVVDTHKLDMVIDEKVLVELKAISEFADIHEAVAVAYLAATKLRVALLLNFGQPKLQFKRIIR
jgi:GxxExxY protein